MPAGAQPPGRRPVAFSQSPVTSATPALVQAAGKLAGGYTGPDTKTASVILRRSMVSSLASSRSEPRAVHHAK